MPRETRDEARNVLLRVLPSLPDEFLCTVVAEQRHPTLGTHCFLWTGGLNRNGYGRIGRGPVAHRAAWKLLLDPDLSDGLHLDHLCRVRNCWRVDHLEPTTPRENTLRGLASLFRPREDYWRPHCFGCYRSPQHDAEADCGTCPHEGACLAEFRAEFAP